jgi:hypothetical protein
MTAETTRLPFFRMGARVAHEVDAAALRGRVHHLGDGRSYAFVGV